MQVQNTTIYEPGSDIGWYNNASSVIRLEYEGALTTLGDQITIMKVLRYTT